MERDHVCVIPRGHTGAKVAIFSTFNDKYAPLAEIARPSWKAYAERHGYALCFYPGEYHEDPSRPQTFGDKGKHRLYYDLRGHCDIVMFLDIDVIIMNPAIKIESVLEDRTFLWTYDDSGPMSGLWIARTDDTTERHLRYAYERASRESNVRYGKIEPNGISDQDSMRDLMVIPPFSQTFGNCEPSIEVGHCFETNYKHGAWLITFPGMSVEQKAERMKIYAAESAKGI